MTENYIKTPRETEAGHCVGIIYGSGVGDGVKAGWLVAWRKYNELYLFGNRESGHFILFCILSIRFFELNCKPIFIVYFSL